MKESDGVGQGTLWGLLGSEQAILLIFEDKHSPKRCFETLKRYFQGQNHHSLILSKCQGMLVGIAES